MSDVNEQLKVLKERADKLGVKYSNNIGLDALRAKVKEAQEEPKKEEAPIDEARAKRLAKAKKRSAAKKDAERLIRIRLTCMNPAKKDWPGEIITVSNSLVGTQRKMIPFSGQEDGYHVPNFYL